MTEKVGRNDPCPCGSGKKYKSCCWTKKHTKKKLTAKWLNQPAIPNLIERTFGASISKTLGKMPPKLPAGENPILPPEHVSDKNVE